MSSFIRSIKPSRTGNYAKYTPRIRDLGNLWPQSYLASCTFRQLATMSVITTPAGSLMSMGNFPTTFGQIGNVAGTTYQTNYSANNPANWKCFPLAWNGLE